MKTTPCVIFFTGLSGAGKTTLAMALMQQLQQSGNNTVLLDGDEIRKKIQLTAFDEASRKQHNLRVGKLAADAEAAGNIVIVALISPYKSVRNEIRTFCRRFIEVHLSTPINICIERDPKGLYKKALAGEITDFTGLSAPYEAPDNPELIIDTSTVTIETCMEKLIAVINQEK